MDASAGESFRSTPGEAAAGVSAQASKDAGRRAALFEGAAAAGFRGVVAAGLHARGVIFPAYWYGTDDYYGDHAMRVSWEERAVVAWARANGYHIPIFNPVA